MKKNPKIVIVGGGPTGIGAAYHLSKLGHTNWVLYEKNNYFGGHSSTHRDERGFLWDEGGHVLFSHFKYYDDFVKEMLGENYFRHRRESWVKLPTAWVPYPFQNNIGHLSAEDQLKSILGIVKAQSILARPKNFKEWIIKTFGDGIAELFMFPYNFKVWAVPPEMMSKDWIAERVSVVNLEHILQQLVLKRDDDAWGPNNTFIFPKYGGTREAYELAGRSFPKQNVRMGKKLVGVSLKKKTVTFSDGTKDSFDFLISTVPVNELIGMTGDAPAALRVAGSKLLFNGIYVIGIGLKKKISTTKYWTYFTDPRTPFYRLSFFHNYSPNLVPNGDVSTYSSLMCEVSYSKYKKVDQASVVKDTIDALIREGIIGAEDRKKIISQSLYKLPIAYPIPTIDRDAQLKIIQPALMRSGVYSRGRFGAWKYEIANMDHSFMQGVEAVDVILKNKKETVWTL